MNEQLLNVDPSMIHASNTNPRQTVNLDEELELAEDIKAHGIISPLDVRPPDDGELALAGASNHDHPDPFYILIDGYRRLRAARSLRLEFVPVIVRPVTAKAAEQMQLISFMQRKNLEPMDEAEALGRLIKKGNDFKMISMQIGKSVAYVARRCQLTQLIDKAVEALRSGKLPVTHALEICRLDPASQSEMLKLCLNKNNPLTYLELVEEIRRCVFSDLRKAPFATEDVFLVPKAGACSKCPKRSGNAPDLFGPLEAGPMICTDASCYTAKVKAHIQRVIDEKEHKDLKVVKISANWSYGKSGGMKRDKYDKVAVKDATHYGILVDGDEFGHLVPIAVKGAEQPDKGEPAQQRHLSPEEARRRYKRRIEIWQNKIEMQTREQLLRSLIARVKWPLHRKELELLPAEYIRRAGQSVHRPELEPIFKLFNLKLPGKLYNVEDWIRKISKKLEDQQLAQLTLALVLSDELIRDPSYIQRAEKFDEVLQAHKDVDRKKLHAAIELQMKAKRPKPFKSVKVEKPKAKKPGLSLDNIAGITPNMRGTKKAKKTKN